MPAPGLKGQRTKVPSYSFVLRTLPISPAWSKIRHSRMTSAFSCACHQPNFCNGLELQLSLDTMGREPAKTERALQRVACRTKDTAGHDWPRTLPGDNQQE